MNLTKVYVAITMTTVLIATYFSVTCEEKLVPIVEMGIQKEEPSSSLIQTSESMLSNTPESDSATSSIQTLSVTVLRTPNAAPNASSTSEIVPILPAPSVPSNAGFVIALAYGVCGVIALVVATGVAGYCLLLSRQAREARARRELGTDLSSEVRSDEQDGSTTAESTFASSSASSDSRFAFGMSFKFGSDQTTNGLVGGAGGSS